MPVAASKTSSLGLRCAEAVLQRIDQQSLTSSNRHVLDNLPREAATALFAALMSQADHQVVLSIVDDNGQSQDVRLEALRRSRADLIPFLVEEPQRRPVPLEGGSNSGSEGFASCLRDHYAVDAERPRYLLTITPRGNETQKSAQDARADHALLDLHLLLHTALDELGMDAADPLRRVADVYLSFQGRNETWSSILSRWDSYIERVRGLTRSEQGASLPLLGCFLPDHSEDFAADEPRVQILSDSDDQKRRRPGDPLSQTRLFDNALLRSFLSDVFANPIEDPEHVLGEVFEGEPEKAQAILQGGLSGLDSLEFGTFAAMDQIQKRREKNAFVHDRISVDGALFWKPFEQRDNRILVISAIEEVHIKIGLRRGFNPRKERAQAATWKTDQGKIEPQEVFVAENAEEAMFTIMAPAPGSFTVYRLALTRGPRSLRNPVDSLTVGLYGASESEILVEEDRQLSLDDQAWIAEGESSFVRYSPTFDAEPIVVSAQEDVADSPTIDGAKIVRLVFVESPLRPLVIGRRPDEPDDNDDTGSFEHERLLELAAYTVKIGDRTRDAFSGVPYYLDTVRQIDDNGVRWRVDLEGGICREIHPSGPEGLNAFLPEQTVARLLVSPETLGFQWSAEGGFTPVAALGSPFEQWARFVESRKAVFASIRRIAIDCIPRFRRELPDAGVPLWLLPLHRVSSQIAAYVDAWCAAIDESFARSKQYEAVHDHLLQLDTLVVNEGDRVQRLVLLPTNPWMLASLGRYQALLANNFSRKTNTALPLRREEVEQLVPKTAIEDWYLPQGSGVRLRLTDSAPFHLEFLPESQHRSRATLDYVERIVANKIERYLRMHPHLRTERRTLRIGFINPGDGRHLLSGLKRWLSNLMRERSGRLRILPTEEIPSFDVFLFSTDGQENDLGATFEQFFRQQVNAADEDAIQQTLVSRLRYRKSGKRGPTSPADAVHICFVHGLVDASKQASKTGSLAEWWDGGFGDGLLTTYLRRTTPGAAGHLQSRRGLWLDIKSKGLRGALARLVALQRGCRDSDLESSKAIYWECPLPDITQMGNIYHFSDWVVHLDRELSLELFTKTRADDAPTIIEYSDQEVPDSPGFDTITVTRYADPYREQLGEILTTVALDIQGRGDDARRAAHRILDDINVLSGSWALDFLMGSIAGRKYSLRLKGNVGAALAYRWLKRIERPSYGGSVLETNVGAVVPIVVSLEELLRVTPAAGLLQRDGLVHRYTNEDEKDEKIAKYCDDLLVLYVPASKEGEPSRLFGRVIEVKFGTTASGAREKAVQQVRTTHDLLQKHLGGKSETVEASFRHKQLSLLIKAQLEQSVAMGVLGADVYEFLNIPVLSANLATGNYEVDYTLGVDGQHILGDAFLLDTREPQVASTNVVELDNGVRVITLPRLLVEWLAFEPDTSPTLVERPATTMPRLGHYQTIKTASGVSRRPALAVQDAPTTASRLMNAPPAVSGLRNVQLELVPGECTSESEGPAGVAEMEAMPGASSAPAGATEQASSTVAPDPASRVTLEVAVRTAVKDAPYPDSAVVDAINRIDRALRGHRVRLASPPSARETDRGPRLLRVYLRLEAGESISSLRRISEDLAREVGTESSDLHVTNVPERHAVAIDLPLRGLTYSVDFHELVGHPSFTAAQEELTLGFCAGIDVTGRPVWTDLAQMPHMLVAGTTGSGKTVFLRNVILALLMHNGPERLLLRMCSSKPMDFRTFTQVPHASGVPMATDATQAVLVAQELVAEMDRRIARISEAYCDNLSEFNREHRAEALPYIVAVFDEYAEMISSFGDKEARVGFETAMGRLAQKARAAGIHLIICMQRPDANALKGPIKANILHRFALKLPQQHDSQIILDEGGAETLLGQGDLLYKDASNRMYRLQVPNLENGYLKDILRRISDGKTVSTVDLDASRTCPKCGGIGSIRELFGTRKMRSKRRDGSEAVTERAQSYCRNCRSGFAG